MDNSWELHAVTFGASPATGTSSPFQGRARAAVQSYNDLWYGESMDPEALAVQCSRQFQVIKSISEQQTPKRSMHADKSDQHSRFLSHA